MSTIKTKSPKWSVGMRIVDALFGEGTITEVNRLCVTIRFDKRQWILGEFTNKFWDYKRNLVKVPTPKPVQKPTNYDDDIE